MAQDKTHIIYCYQFQDKSAYIGQTSQKQHYRIAQHVRDGILLGREKTFQAYIVLENNIAAANVSEREKHWHGTYKKKGWSMLNNESAIGTLGHCQNRNDSSREKLTHVYRVRITDSLAGQIRILSKARRSMIAETMREVLRKLIQHEKV